MKNIIFICGAGGIKAATFIDSLKEHCESLGYRFYLPVMPGFDEEITYEKYVKVFEDTLKQIDDTENTTVIAHSAGNWFFVKYMYEKNIKFENYIACATGAGADKPFVSSVADKLTKMALEFTPDIFEFAYFRNIPFKNKIFIYGGKDKFFTRDSQESYGSLIGAKKWYVPDMPHYTRAENILEFKELHKLIKNNFKLK